MYSDIFCKVYNEFGWNYYPEIFGEQLLAWMTEKQIVPRTALDLACGTGILCEILHRQGIAVSGMTLHAPAYQTPSIAAMAEGCRSIRIATLCPRIPRDKSALPMQHVVLCSASKQSDSFPIPSENATFSGSRADVASRYSSTFLIRISNLLFDMGICRFYTGICRGFLPSLPSLTPIQARGWA
jgi:hypothetical protein